LDHPDLAPFTQNTPNLLIRIITNSGGTYRCPTDFLFRKKYASQEISGITPFLANNSGYFRKLLVSPVLIFA
jgi:hypothetical protein